MTIFRSNRGAQTFFTACALLACGSATFVHAQETTFTVLHSFSVIDGAEPVDGLVVGTDDKLYGTTLLGGAGSGTIFSLSTEGAFGLVYSFSPDLGGINADGSSPGELMIATNGFLYGTTAHAGPKGGGTIFRLTDGPPTILHAFDGSDGRTPFAGLLQARDGNLYGTTCSGGSLGDDGTIFRITLDGVFRSLYSLSSEDGDGSCPTGVLLERDKGDLLGTTIRSANGAEGTVFAIGRNGRGFKVIHEFLAFGGTDSGLARGPGGDYFGVTESGGSAGSVFRVDEQDSFSTFFSFPTSNRGSASPGSSLIVGSDGAFYGVKRIGSDAAVEGSIFRLTPDGEFTELHVFTGLDGSDPTARLLELPGGRFFGVTRAGGENDAGTIYKLVIAPSTPRGIEATVVGESVSLSWPAATFAASYNVYITPSGSDEPTAPQLTSIADEEVMVEGLELGTSYEFRVSSANEAGESPKSEPALAALDSGSGGGGGGLLDPALLVFGAFFVFYRRSRGS